MADKPETFGIEHYKNKDQPYRCPIETKERGVEFCKFVVICKKCRAICNLGPGSGDLDFRVEMDCLYGKVYIHTKCVCCKDDLKLDLTELSARD